MAEEKHLLASVLATPDDDLPRLVYADWLRENGQTERADFIEVQMQMAKCELCKDDRDDSWRCFPCYPLQRRERSLLEHHELALLAGAPLLSVGRQENSPWVPEAEWDFRRGFVRRVKIPLRWWCGGECPECNGTGAYVDPRNFDDTGRWIGEYETTNCDQCGGDGKITAIGPQVVARHPVAEVRLSDWEPAQGRTDEWAWYFAYEPQQPHHLSLDFGRRDTYARFDTREGAVRWASESALLWARAKAQPA